MGMPEQAFANMRVVDLFPFFIVVFAMCVRPLHARTHRCPELHMYVRLCHHQRTKNTT